VIVDRTRALEVLIGLPDVEFVGLDDSDAVLRIVIEQRVERPSCPACAMAATVKERHEVELVDLPAFGRPTRIVWRKHRWSCPSGACTVGSWTGQDPRIAPARAVMTDRCARWCVREVGELGRPVNDVARMLGCDWHTVNDSVIRYGEALLDADTERIGPTRALGLDETLFVRRGPFRAQCWSTQIVDVEHGVLLDVVEGRSADEACRWLMFRDVEWLGGIDFGTLDLSSTYRKVFETMLPWVTLIADPFHVVRIATHRLDEVRRRVQNETVGHRGRKTDPLYRARRLLTRAHERLSDDAHAKLVGLLDAGDPKHEVRDAWHAKEVVRSIYDITDADVADQFVSDLADDLQDRSRPAEVRALGRTLHRWHDQIVAWHEARFTNAPTEAMNNLIKRIKRVAFGFRSFRHYRVRALLYAGRPNWSLLATITP
jgi:transposase